MSEGQPQRIRLGPAVGQLEHARTSGISYATVARLMMRRSWEPTRETVSLPLRDGFERVCAVTVAVPFFNGVGQVLGSIGLFGPSVRMSNDVVQRYGKLLAHEAQQLSFALGWQSGQRAR